MTSPDVDRRGRRRPLGLFLAVGLSVAADSVWVMSNKTTLNVRGSYYNMVDEFYNPSLELGPEGLADYWPNPWYSSLYNSGYVYYPALDVTSGNSQGNRI